MTWTQFALSLSVPIGAAALVLLIISIEDWLDRKHSHPGE
jgi:hypothetical protein